jgi:PKD repeat protein
MHRVKRMSIPKLAVLATGLTAAMLVVTMTPHAAQAMPTYGTGCTGCHTAGGSVTATPIVASVAPGATYTVALAFTGGGSSPVGYAITGNGANVTASNAGPASMTAPAAVGSYTYTVWMRSGVVATTTYKITVAAAPTVITTTTALTMAPTAATAVAPAAKTLTAAVSGAGAAGTVQFFNGTTSLGSSPVASGSATMALTSIAVGSYSYHAVFTPTTAAQFSSSTSGNLAFSVTASPITTVPVGSFTASTVSGTSPLTVSFADTSSGVPTTWAWDLGNGTTSAAKNASVTYAAAGTYAVTLIASNSAGSSVPVTKTITVTDSTPVPSAAHIYRISPDEGSAGNLVTIRGTGFGTAGVVSFGTLTATVSSWTDTTIVVKVPSVTGYSVRTGDDHYSVPVWYRHEQEVSVTVTPMGGAASNGVEFELKSSHHDD